jgi:hypothetical protein
MELSPFRTSNPQTFGGTSASTIHSLKSTFHRLVAVRAQRLQLTAEQIAAGHEWHDVIGDHRRPPPAIGQDTTGAPRVRFEELARSDFPGVSIMPPHC